ncbi:MAG TPA: DUF2059 domain-containing protein [Steroidobacteraceae bacterium]|nr:DUF2059 domain-containing protein [Steroidobacteraceae bacterium]
MLKTAVAALLACLALQTAQADEAPVSDASLRELLEVTQAHKILDTVMGQVDTTIRNTTTQALAGKSLTPEQQTIFDDGRHQMVSVLNEALSWDIMEPLYMDTYRRSFTQSEMDGMLAFYKSPAGQAMIAKLPLVVQNIMQLTGERMQVITPKLEQIQQDMVQRLRATGQASKPGN